MKTGKDFTLRHTIIWHKFRRHYGLSCDEYALCDMVYHLSKSDASDVPGWCYKTKEKMAEELGISKQGLLNMVKRMVDQGFVEKDEQTSYLKTTMKWQQVYLEKDFQPPEKQLTRPPGLNLDHDSVNGKETLPEQSTNLTKVGKETLPNNSIYSSKDNSNDYVDAGVRRKLDVELNKNFSKWTVGEFREIVNSYSDLYHREMLDEFFKHWTPVTRDNFLRFQKEDFWDTELRLSNWYKKQIEINSRTINKPENGPKTYITAPTGAYGRKGTSQGRTDGLRNWGRGAADQGSAGSENNGA